MANANSLSRNYYREKKIDDSNERYNAIDQTKGGESRRLFSGRSSEEQELVFPELTVLDRHGPCGEYKNAGIKTHRRVRDYGTHYNNNIHRGSGIKAPYGSHNVHLASTQFQYKK